jgi:uncharacterized membrane protein ArfC
VNWWLMTLAFVLGVAFTAWFAVRRVTPTVAAPSPQPPAPAVDAPTVHDEPEVVVPEPEPPPAAPIEPHGPGSARPNDAGTGPHGWTVKANEESRLYHSPESPSFGVTRAEVWFRDVETAEAAGFNRWDSGKSQRGMKRDS